MADQTMAEAIENVYWHSHPFKNAYADRKLPCPHRSCQSETGKAFFQDLAQHYRLKHQELAFNKDKHTREARRLFNLFHGNETKLYLTKVFAERSAKGDKYIRYAVTTPFENCLAIEVMAKDHKESAKLAGVVLMHFGLLKPYGEKTRPAIAEVNSEGLCVKFNLWSSKKDIDGRITTVVAKCIFVRRVASLNLLGDHTLAINECDSNIGDMTGKKSVEILNRVFHYDHFQGKQEKAIDSICQGQNTVLIMPTGGGKSICYAVPALMERKLVVVIFPLLSLLLDQFERMKAKGLNVCVLMTDMDDIERQSVIHKLHSNLPVYNCLFLTPETVLSSSVFDLMSKLSSENLISFFVIDEAHCIDKWGFHFRPSYSELWRLGTLGCPIMAMTGTATSRTLTTIIKQF